MANRTFLEKAELQVYHPLHFPHSVHIKLFNIHEQQFLSVLVGYYNFHKTSGFDGNFLLIKTYNW